MKGQHLQLALVGVHIILTSDKNIITKCNYAIQADLDDMRQRFNDKHPGAEVHHRDCECIRCEEIATTF